MRQSTIGINVLEGNAGDHARLFDFLTQLQPKLVVVVGDDGVVARKALEILPEARVVYRHWVPDVNPPQNRGDGYLGNMKSPRWYVEEACSRVPAPGIIHVGNELGPSKATADFMRSAMDELDARGRVGALIGVAMGNEEVEEYTGPLAPFLRRLGEHFLSVHEYWDQGNPTFGVGHYLGRAHRYLGAACRRLSLDFPKTLITEHGADSMDPRWAGWRPCGYSEEAYARWLIWADQLYGLLGGCGPRAIFCWSMDTWQDHSIAQALTVQDLLVKYAQAPEPWMRWAQGILGSTAHATCVRSGPGMVYPVIGQVPAAGAGAIADVSDRFLIRADHEDWRTVSIDGKAGWAVDRYLKWLTDPVPVTPPAPPGPPEHPSPEPAPPEPAPPTDLTWSIEFLKNQIELGQAMARATQAKANSWGTWVAYVEEVLARLEAEP